MEDGAWSERDRQGATGGWLPEQQADGTCFTSIAAPWYGQKIFAAKDARTAVLAVALSACLGFVLYGVPLIFVVGVAVSLASQQRVRDAT